jgi:hypothetical protein
MPAPDHTMAAISGILTAARIDHHVPPDAQVIFLLGDTAITIRPFGRDAWAILRQIDGDDVAVWQGAAAELITHLQQARAAEAGDNG